MPVRRRLPQPGAPDGAGSGRVRDAGAQEQGAGVAAAVGGGAVNNVLAAGVPAALGDAAAAALPAEV